MRKPAWIVVAQADEVTIGGMRAEQRMQESIGTVAEADDRIAAAHVRFSAAILAAILAPMTPLDYFSPVLAIP